MTRGKLLLAAAASSALLALASPASAAGFVNGSFENTCVGSPGGFVTLGAGDTCINGWTVGPHSVDLVGGYWQAKDGLNSIDLGGLADGSIFQEFDTVLGGLYTVKYWVSANPDSPVPDPVKDGLISAINGTVVSSATFNGFVLGDKTNMMYLQKSFQFTAQGTKTTLSFASGLYDPDTGEIITADGAYGPVLDMVQVIAPVPEPATWAMMLLGFGAVGFGLRKRKATQGQTRLRVAYV